MINKNLKILFIAEESTPIKEVLQSFTHQIVILDVDGAVKVVDDLKPHIIIFYSIDINLVLQLRKKNYNTRFIYLYKVFPLDIETFSLCQISSILNIDNFNKGDFFTELNQVILEYEEQQKSFVVSLRDQYSWQSFDKILYDNNYNKIDISKNESLILDLLIRNTNKTLSSATIIDYLEIKGVVVSVYSLRNIISKLRKKIPENSIQSVYGEGYRFKIDLHNKKFSFNEFRTIEQLLKPLQTIDEVGKIFCDHLFQLYQPDRSFLMYVDQEKNQIIVPYETSVSKYPGAAKLKINIPITKVQAIFFESIVSVSDPIILSQLDMQGLKKEDPIVWKEMAVPSSALVYYLNVKGLTWVAGLHQCSHERSWNQDEVIFLKHSVKLLQEKMIEISEKENH